MASVEIVREGLGVGGALARVLCAAGLVACSGASAKSRLPAEPGPASTQPESPTVAVPQGPAPEWREPKPLYPEGAQGPSLSPALPCVAQIDLKVERAAGRVHLLAELSSNSDEAVTVTLLDRCPAGALQVTGFPQGFDLFGTCNAGACLASQAPRQFALPPGRGKVLLASLSWAEKGDACRTPLPPGTYNLYASATVLAPQGAVTCGAAFAQLQIPSPPAPPAAPRAPCPPQPTCGITCPGGRFAHDANGCTLCGCEEEPQVFTR